MRQFTAEPEWVGSVGVVFKNRNAVSLVSSPQKSGLVHTVHAGNLPGFYSNRKINSLHANITSRA